MTYYAGKGGMGLLLPLRFDARTDCCWWSVDKRNGRLEMRVYPLGSSALAGQPCAQRAGGGAVGSSVLH